MRLRILLSLAMLLCAVPTFGVTNLFYTQAGGGTGTSCVNPKSAAQFNTAGSDWTAGNILHICGTFTGTTGTTMLIAQGSGSSGNPITIKFEVGANLTSPAWGPFGAIQINGQNWITIDGGSNGIIQNTANGTGLANAANSKGVWMGGSSNIVVQNVTIANICQHTSVTDSTGCNTSGTDDACITISNNGSSGSNITITQNTIHDCHTGVDILLNAGDSGIVVTYNTISRTNWGAGFGAGAGSSGSITFTNNDVTCVVASPCNWNDNGNVFHHNGMIVDPGNGVTMTNQVYTNNYFHDINPSTGYIFLDPSGTGDTPSIQIYNNIGFTTAGQAGPANAYWQVGIGVSNAKVYNNTTVGPGNQCMSGQVSPTYKNNICKDMSTGVLLNSGFSGVVSDYQTFFNLTGSGNQFVAGPTNYANLAAWQPGTGLDAHSISTDPTLTAAFLLNSGSPAIGAGINLTSLSIAGLLIGAPQTFGVGGTCGTGCLARSASAPWDMGAYPFSAAPGGGATVPTGILPIALASGQVGVVYPAVQFNVTGGVPPDTFTAAGIPPGFSMSAGGSFSSLSPTIAGTYFPKVTATDSNGATVAQNYSITIAPVPQSANAIFLMTCPLPKPGKSTKESVSIASNGAYFASGMCTIVKQ